MDLKLEARALGKFGVVWRGRRELGREGSLIWGASGMGRLLFSLGGWNAAAGVWVSGGSGGDRDAERQREIRDRESARERARASFRG